MIDLSPIGTAAGLIGDTIHDRRQQGYENDQEEYAKRIQEIVAMYRNDPQAAQEAMAAFIAQEGGNLDPGLKSKANQAEGQINKEVAADKQQAGASPTGEPTDLFPQFIDATMNGLATRRSGAPRPHTFNYRKDITGNTASPSRGRGDFGGLSGRGGAVWTPEGVQPPSGKYFQNPNKDVYGYGGVKLYDAKEVIEGDNITENLLALKNEVEQYKGWQESTKNSIDQAFKDDYIQQYLPPGMTKESLLTEIAAGNGTGLFFLTEGLKKSHEVGLDEVVFEDPRSKNVRKIKTQEDREAWKWKTDYSHMLSMKRIGAQKAGSKDAKGVRWDQAAKLGDVNEVIGKQNEAIVLLSSNINGKLSEAGITDNMNDRSVGAGGIDLTDVELAYELNDILANVDNVSAKKWEEEKNDVAQDYVARFPGSDYNIVRRQIDIVTDKYKDIDPQLKTEIFGAVGQIETARNIAKGAQATYQVVSARAMVNPDPTNVTNIPPELAGAVEIIRTGDPKSAEYKKAGNQLLSYEYGLNSKGVDTALFIGDLNNFPYQEPQPGILGRAADAVLPGINKYGGQILEGAESAVNYVGKQKDNLLGGGETAVPTVPVPTKKDSAMIQAKSLGDVWGNQDGRLSNAEIESLATTEEGIALASKHIISWSMLTPEQRIALLHSSQGE